MSRVRIGVLGAANIARKVVIPSILTAEGVELVAIASESGEAPSSSPRPISRPATAGRSARPSVSAPMRSCSRRPTSTRSTSRCRTTCTPSGRSGPPTRASTKPAARTADEAADAIEHCVARGVVWMEAFMYRFHPQWRLVFEELESGAIGELRTVRSIFTFTVTSPENVRRRPELGGGSLYDVGYYCVNAARWTIGREPVRATALMHMSPEGVDEELQGLLDFGDGRSALVASSFCQPYRREVELLGTEGRILVPNAFMNGSEPLGLEVEDARGERRPVDTPGGDEYRLEVEDFARCVGDGRQPEVVSHEDTIGNMRAIDALYASARTGHAVRLAAADDR